MTTTATKIRTTIAVLAAALSFGLVMGPVATSEAAVANAKPTGNAELDAICQKMAALINHAYSQGDLALVNGNDAEADAWYDLAAYMIRRGTAAGCDFRARVVAPTPGLRGPDGLQVSPGTATSVVSPKAALRIKSTRLKMRRLVRAAR